MAHIHATIVASHLNLDELRHALIEEMMNVEYASAIFTTADVVPKVHVGTPHKDAGGMVRTIQYSMKTFGSSPGDKKPSLPDLYRAARAMHQHHIVNDNIRELVQIFHQVTFKKHRTSSLGVLSHMAKESLRVPKAKQYGAKNRVLVKVAKTKAKHAALWDGIEDLEDGGAA